MEFPFLGVEAVEKTGDIADSSQFGVFVLLEVGDVAEAGNTGLIEEYFIVFAFETTDERRSQELLDHLRVKSRKPRRFIEVCHQFLKTRSL